MDTEISKKVFEEPYGGVLKKIIEKIGYDYTIELEIPEDHIHKVVRSEPKISPSEMMQIIKSLAARGVWRYDCVNFCEEYIENNITERK